MRVGGGDSAASPDSAAAHRRTDPFSNKDSKLSPEPGSELKRTWRAVSILNYVIRTGVT
jgi:hypothetical protein